jgi:K+-transporting ATPase KdpF subunit
VEDDRAMFENVIGGGVSLGILVYLLWALLEPERF